ncbi:MAG: bifunctional precorrin-2 dehydrogenase/sirohydrochlorin ferrochelatase [Desulfonatronovibrio sp.]
MRYYPLFLDISHKTCMVAGAGTVGTRKIKTLIQCSPERIIVIDPHASTIDIPDPKNIIRHLREDFTPDHLKGCSLVFACTNNPEVNNLIVESCREKNIWCNVAERPELGDFILPGVFSRDDLIIAVSTCGCSPALTAKIKNDLNEIYGSEYALLTQLMAEVRNLILPLNFPQKNNREYFRKVVNSNALELLESGKKQELIFLLKEILPKQTHNQIQGVTDALL